MKRAATISCLPVTVSLLAFFVASLAAQKDNNGLAEVTRK